MDGKAEVSDSKMRCSDLCMLSDYDNDDGEQALKRRLVKAIRFAEDPFNRR